MNNKQKMLDEKEEFWMEQHSFGEYPYDKPDLNPSTITFHMQSNKKNIVNTLKNIEKFLKELCNTNTSEKILHYPLL
jgi:hypothetical protein